MPGVEDGTGRQATMLEVGPVPANRLAAPVLPLSTRPAATSEPEVAPFVGRHSERSALLDAVTAPPALVMIEGETGVGKTALIRSALRDPALSGTTPLVGHCQPLREPLPLGPVVEALAHVASRLNPRLLNPVTGALRPLLPELGDVLPDAPDPLPNRAAEQHRVFRALVELLEAVAPAVLVVEDLQWVDGVTDEFLGFLTAAMPPRVGVVVSYRPEDLPARAARWLARRPHRSSERRVGLQPLDELEVGELVSELLGAEHVSREFAAFLHERTAGLPFAIEELLQLLRDTQVVLHRDGVWLRRGLDEIDVPPSVSATVLARLEQLPARARRAAEALAVLAGPASIASIAATADMDDDEVVAGLDALYVGRLLHEARRGAWEFRHALAQQAVAEALPAPRRSWLHRRAARYLEKVDPPPFAALARHRKEAGQVAEWVLSAEAAADQAASAGNHGTAADLLHDVVISDVVDLTDRARLAIAYGEAAGYARDHRRGIAALRGLLDERALDTTSRARVRLRLGLLLVQGGHPGDARRELASVVEKLPDHPDEAARGMCNLGYPWLDDSHVEEHVHWLERAAGLAGEVGNHYIVAAAKADRAFVRVTAGDPDSWRTAEQLLLEGATPTQERMRLAYNLAYSCVSIGHVRRARTLLGTARRIADELQDQRFGPPMAGVALWLDWFAGDWHGLDVRARELTATARDSPTASTAAQLVEAATLAAQEGDANAGLEALRTVAEEAITAGEFGQFIHACSELAHIAAVVGDHDKALAATRGGLSLARAKGLWPWAAELVPWRVQALVATGAMDEAATLTTDVDDRVAGRDAPSAHASLAYARALVAVAAGDVSTAAAGFAEAQRRWEALPRPHLAAQAAAEHGRLLAGSDRDRGVELLQAAAARLADMGASWDAARVQQQLRDIGVQAGSRRGRRGYGSALSPREREVAALAVAGLTNPEIAQRLVLSPRTIDRHISNVLRKLDVSSRDEIVLPDPADSDAE